MKYWKLPKYIVLLITLCIVVIIVFAIQASNTTRKRIPHTVRKFNEGWSISVNGNALEGDDLVRVDIGVINELEEVVISKTLGDLGLSNPCLTFYTLHSVVEIYMDGEEIYSYGQALYDTNNVVPKKYHHISLGTDYQGKELTIKLIGARRAAFSGLSNVFIGTRSDILALYLSSSEISLITGYFLFTLGLLLVVLSPYLFVYHNRDLRIFFSGLTSLTLAIYIMGYAGIFSMLINNALVNTVLEFSALYNIPTVILGYLMSAFDGKAKKIFTIMFGFDVFLFITSIILHVTKLARFSDFTVVLHIVAISECIISIYVIVTNYLGQQKDGPTRAYSSENVFMGGLILFMLLSLVDIAKYNAQKYISETSEAGISLYGFTIGALVFVTSLLISYFFYNINSSNLNSMESRIKSIAYTDALTGLSNRARCEQMMAMLSEEHGTYAIISLDLNWLKQVNDTLGHHEGDRLLTGFSTILTDSFWDANLIGRMGGDEFLIILLEDRTLNLTKRIHELYSLINEWNNKEQKFRYSASYGYAYSYEVPNGSAEEVYMLADSRMYEMKREQHENEEKGVIVNA
ncbi:MAG: GGDEF domain-containing protein [Butyrivibrio sp.]|nr:GGDEF domain-containing protein [Butyrivibrio sp.]